MSHNDSTSPILTLRLGDRGRLVLPATVRKSLGLRAGDSLALRVDDSGVIHLSPARHTARKGRGLLGGKSGARRLVDELLEERRREADSG